MTGPIRRVLRRDPLANPGPLVERVHSYVAYRIGAGAEADDVTGEAFARAVRYRDSYDASKGAPVDWMIGIARRCIDDALSGRRQEPDPRDDTPAAGDLEADTVDRLALWQAVGQLGERDRELIALRYGADMSAKQIARQLEMNTNAVEVALHRALGRLRPLLEEPAPPATPSTREGSARSPRRTPPAGGTREPPPRG